MARPVITVRVRGEEQLSEGFKKAPQFTVTKLKNAINASLFIIEKNAVDRNFQFKTSRSERTGELQASFAQGTSLATERNLQGSIGPTVKYAEWVHNGTDPYTIVPQTAKALHWDGNFAKRVRHPGIEPNPFMERIAEAANPEIQDKFEDAMRQIANKIANQ